MEIFGIYISPWLIITVLLMAVLYGGIRHLAFRFRTSAYALLWNALLKAIREENPEGLDLKAYDMTEDIKSIDGEFNQAEFEQLVENVLRQYCQAMSQNDARILLSVESPNLFQRHQAVIEQNKKIGLKDVHKLVDLLGINYTGVNIRQNKLKAEVRVNILRYKVNNNGTLISGSQSDIRKLIYEMVFIKENRPKEVNQTVNCPNCGAPHTIHSAGICQYCASMIVVAKDNWVLDDLRQR